MNMKKIGLLCIGFVVLGISACQTTPRQYNGMTGYQIESQTATSATLAYTLAGSVNRDIDTNKLQHTCQKVLGPSKTYKIDLLSATEIANPQLNQDEKYGIKLGHSKTSFEFSNTPDLNNSEDYGVRQALETRPSSLYVLRYTCS